MIPGEHPIRSANGKMYHYNCLVCICCDKPFGEGESITLVEEMMFCKGCVEAAVGARCALCDQLIPAGTPHVKALEKVEYFI